MPTVAPAADFAERCGLGGVPESVRRLGQLVSRPEATTEEVAQLICQDREFTARLLRAANPRAASEAQYTCTTVAEALQRTGMGSALLVAMHVPLLSAVQRTFSTMLGVELELLAPADLPVLGEHALCEITFTGKATGSAALRLTRPAARQIAARVLGLPPAGFVAPDLIDDVIVELTNMVVGNFKSNLCDAGLNCKLSPPVLTRASDARLRATADGLAERLGLRSSDLDLFVDLNVNPWGE